MRNRSRQVYVHYENNGNYMITGDTNEKERTRKENEKEKHVDASLSLYAKARVLHLAIVRRERLNERRREEKDAMINCDRTPSATDLLSLERRQKSSR